MFKFSFCLLSCGTLSEPLQPAEKHRDCRDNVRLGAENEFPLIMLSSLQGSGNTWTRMLIESATGIYTGSKYNERRIYEESGFLGELEDFQNGKTIAIKNHGLDYVEKAAAVLLIMRNPYDAFKAEFNRKQTDRNPDGNGRSHIGHADPKAFNTTIWDDTVKHVSNRWKKIYVGYVKKCSTLKIPLHVIYYENLKSNTIKEVTDMLNFYKESINFVPDNMDDRIDCLTQASMDTFKRKKSELDWEIYHPYQIDLINAAISDVEAVFHQFNIPDMPYYYKNNPTSDESLSTSPRQSL